MQDGYSPTNGCNEMNEELQFPVERSMTRIALRRKRARRRHAALRRAMRIFWVLVIALALGRGMWWLHGYLRQPFAIVWHRTPIIVLATEMQCEQAISQYKQSFAPGAPEVIQIDRGEFSIVRAQQAEPVRSISEAVSALQGLKLKAFIDGYAIIVNGKPMLLLASKEDAANALALMQQQALGDGGGMPTFDQRIIVEHRRQQIEGNAPQLPLMTPQQAASELMHPPTPNYATVGHGDSFFSIAIRHHITVQDIKTLNPSVDSGKLHPGDTLRLPDTLPPVTVTIHQRV